MLPPLRGERKSLLFWRLLELSIFTLLAFAPPVSIMRMFTAERFWKKQVGFPSPTEAAVEKTVPQKCPVANERRC